ncbi:substrate-binding periplasmic protein [Pseudomonas turukhanskensis]|uniref:ABC transporter substrate-binding protein n=1 Tax=Pseudomonas turukhanskensis TaxID=1806536 RepID=A0A9W6KCN3_9PSED|nr:transporter substrate-binding domain-containing protein [Pseudomonas turukhanskensis]GLK92234.1 ABC transporter substrate-binding protein [Pseudomonas turukhanskensis]
MRWSVLLITLLCQFAFADEHAPLRVMTDLWPPFRMEDSQGNLVGLDIDVLNEIGRRSGLRFAIKRAPWARGLADLQQGRADLMIGLAKTPDREQYIQYLPRPYYACAPRFYTAAGEAEQLQSYADLKDKVVGYVHESAYFQPFDSDSTLLKRGVNNEQQLLQMLLRGRLNAVIGTDCQVDFELLQPQYAKRIAKAQYLPDAHTQLFIGFSRASARLHEETLVTTALQQLLEEGWIKRQAQRYQAQR